MVYSEIIGVGHYVPARIVKNKELEKYVETSDQWIASRTGIKERRITMGEKTSKLGVSAARKALEQAEINAREIDMIILATITPEFFTPSTANLVQAELGLQEIPSFDISAGCTGFIYALQIADQFIKSGQCQTILVIGAETLSKITDWQDRNTCVLFGDGAGAAILRKSNQQGIVSTYTGSQGDREGFLTAPAVALANPFFGQHDSDQPSFIAMNGKEIFKFATQIMVKSIDYLLKINHLTIDEIDYIIPHQANYRIIDYVAKKYAIHSDKFYKNMDRFGNTSAASIPIALAEMHHRQMLDSGDRIIMVGFGGGLTWGSVLFHWTL